MREISFKFLIILLFGSSSYQTELGLALMEGFLNEPSKEFESGSSLETNRFPYMIPIIELIDIGDIFLVQINVLFVKIISGDRSI